MGLFCNNLTGTLASAIGAADTTISVSGVRGIYTETDTFWIVIDGEILAVTSSVASGTWTVVRGADGTAASSHASGSSFLGTLCREAIGGLLSLNSGGANHSNRRAVNFVGASVTDDASNGRCNVSFPGLVVGDGTARAVASQSGNLYVPTSGAITSLDSGSAWFGFNPYGKPFSIPPASTSFSAVNVSGEATVTDVPGGGIVAVPTDMSLSNKFSALVAPISNSSSYAATVAVRWFGDYNANIGGGVVLMDSSKQKSCPFWIDSNNNGNAGGAHVAVEEWNDANTGIRNMFQGYYAVATGVMWLRVSSNGGTRSYSLSIDGLNWTTVYSESSGTWITESYAGLVWRDRVQSGMIDGPINFLSWSLS